MAFPLAQPANSSTGWDVPLNANFGSLNDMLGTPVYVNAYATLALAITAAAGKTLVINSVIAVAVSVAIPVDCIVVEGGSFTIAGGQVLTFQGSFSAGLYPVFTGTGTVTFTTNVAFVRPEWWGAKADGTGYPVIGATDNLAPFQKALAALPVYAGLPSQAPYHLADGSYARTGKILFSLGRYVISDTWVMSPFVTYECPSYVGTFICLEDGVAASGSEKWVLNVQALTGPSPNTSYGCQFRNMAVEGNANVGAGGSNVKASGVIMNGAQGTQLGSLWIENVGIRGFWLQNSGSNLSGLGGYSDLEVLGCNIGPGVQLDAAFANFGTIRAEVVNTAGSNVDADGDPNPGVLIGSAGSNGAVNVNIDMFGAEFTYLPMKIWGGAAITVKNTTLGYTGGAPTGIIISHGAYDVAFGPVFTFASSPNLFTNFIVDRVNSVSIPGNFGNFPAIAGYPLSVRPVAQVNLTAQTAAIGTTTLFTTVVAGEYRLRWNAKVTTVASTGAGTSTLGALTIVYTDPDGVVQTITAPASVAAGTIATSSAGNTTATVLLGLDLMLNCKAATVISYAMAYASNTAAQMAYNLHISLDGTFY